VDYTVKSMNFMVTLIWVALLAGVCIYGLLVATEDVPRGLSAVGLLGAILFPLTQLDLSDEIPEIKTLKKENKQFSSLKIKHPNRTWTIILCILAPFTVGLTWLWALWNVTGTVTVRIPEDAAIAAGLKEQQKTVVVQESKQATASEELVRWKKLLDDGAISQEEFDQKKKDLL